MRGLVLVLVAAAGCGPIEYVNQVTRKASTSVSSAKAADADKNSPYYYTLAQEYLHKAREEAAAADFQAANRFGRRAQEAAEKAKAESIANAGKPVENFYPGFAAPAPEGTAPPPAGKKKELAPLEDETGEDEVPAELGGETDK